MSEISIAFGPMRSIWLAQARGIAMSSGISIHSVRRSSCGDDEHAAAIDAELAHHGGMRALQDLEDLAFGAARSARSA